MKINKKIIEELTEYLKEFNLSEIEYAEGTTKVKVSRSISASAIAPSEVKKKQEAIELIKLNYFSILIDKTKKFARLSSPF